MFRKLMLVAGFTAATMAMASPGFAAEWVVIHATDGCYVTDEMGGDKVGGPYATKEEATAEMKKIPMCDEANVTLDPDEDRDSR